MDISKVDKKILKEVVKEILLEDVRIFKGIIEEIFLENDIIVSKEQMQRRLKIEAMIKEDFDKYDNVFKKLA